MVMLLVGLRSWNILHRQCRLRLLVLGPLQDSNWMPMAGMRLARMLLWLISRSRLGINGLLRGYLRLGCRLLLLPHRGLYLLKAHHLAPPRWLSCRLSCWLRRGSLGCGLCRANTPDAAVNIEVGHRFSFPIFFVSCAGRMIARLYRLACIVGALALVLGLGLTGARPRSRLLSIEAEMLFLDGPGYLGCLSKEVKVLANFSSASRLGGTAATSKGIIVERIVSIVELVPQAIVGIFELERFIWVFAPPRQSREGIVGLGETRPCLVVAACIEAEEGHVELRLNE